MFTVCSQKYRRRRTNLVIPHFPFEQLHHAGGLAFHQGVKCLIFLLVSFFFLHNECKSKNVNKAFPHCTHALLPPPACQPGSDLPDPQDTAPLPSESQPPPPRRAPSAPPPRRPGPRGGARPRRATTRKALPSTAVTSAAVASAATGPPPAPAPARLSRRWRGAARRPRFLCTLERVINLK